MSKNPVSGQLTTLSAATTVVGDIIVQNDIRIAGTIKGKLETSGHLIVEQTGLIEGEIKANAATIAGKVNGNLNIEEKLVLENKAQLNGDLKTKLLCIEEGASFNGTSATSSSGASAPSVKINL